MPDWTAISNSLGIEHVAIKPAAGGCINVAATLTSTSAKSIFVKVNAASKAKMFEAEAEALHAISATGSIRVPRPVGTGVVGDEAYLALEHIDLCSPAARSWEDLGRQLAELHHHTAQDGRFGWHRDNYIGEIEQPNTAEADWAGFFTRHRLQHQLELADQNGYRFDGASEILHWSRETLAGHTPPASLLHGDLWSGNASFTTGGEPVIFDPASYYGDPETDLAFTEMFGGFDRRFYRAYREANPPKPGHEVRKMLYNLYHLINHTNHFGGSYATSAQDCIHRLLRA